MPVLTCSIYFYTMAILNQYQKIVPFIVFILALLLFFKLIQPMITVLLSSILLAYLSFPLYKRIHKKIKNNALSIIFSLCIVAIIILIPFFFLAFEITHQGYSLYNSLSSKVEKGELFGLACTSEDSKVCSLLNRAEKFNTDQLSKLGIDKKLQSLKPILEEKITSFILSIPLIIAQIFLTFIIAYFILKDREIILKKMSDLLPMRTKTKKRLTREFGNITHTVIYAQLFVALVQGIVGTIGFYLFGVPFPIILGLIMAFFALIPTIGTAIIWLPASLFLILSGYFSHNYWVLGKGIALFLYGLLIIGTIDNILLAKIVHKKAKVNQIVVIIGVIGGACLFGIVGIFIGPILLPLLMTYFETFKERLS
ncbi:AI-2E family transporter [Candidatus Woesearchaeota archaeon]|nr:MAG: AI-2E family transporter [Candidatus Woesearchaeota archaeon]